MRSVCTTFGVASACSVATVASAAGVILFTIMLMVAISKEAFITAQHRVAAGAMMIANQQISMLPVMDG
jgi:hypothetical protein